MIMVKKLFAVYEIEEDDLDCFADNRPITQESEKLLLSTNVDKRKMLIRCGKLRAENDGDSVTAEQSRMGVTGFARDVEDLVQIDIQ